MAKKSALPQPISRESDSIQFFSSGCTILDAALGGGWACGRVANILGESSTGKTLLGIEAAASKMALLTVLQRTWNYSIDTSSGFNMLRCKLPSPMWPYHTTSRSG